MTPETLPAAELLDEAARITARLIAIEDSVDRVARSERARQMQDIRAELGYAAVDAVETDQLVDTRIEEKTPVVSPAVLEEALPLSPESAETTNRSRQDIGNIIDHRDDRLLVVVGPCSIHDPEAALEYAKFVKEQREIHGDQLEIVMRFYPEKPRTEKDWKGFIYDPKLDESDDINLGVVATRLSAMQITAMGVPLAMERLNANTPQYVNGLVAYDAIGARNTTDQKQREYASGTSSPVGFKNTPEGSVLAAAQAVRTAREPHTFLGMALAGTPSQIRTTGNQHSHVILRGSDKGPNYSAEHIEEARNTLRQKRIYPISLGIDASHGNSGKKAANQPEVVADIAAQVGSGETDIVMVMIESNLVEGNQPLKNPDGSLKTAQELEYGKSITDECSGLEQTADMIQVLAGSVEDKRAFLKTVPEPPFQIFDSQS